MSERLRHMPEASLKKEAIDAPHQSSEQPTREQEFQETPGFTDLQPEEKTFLEKRKKQQIIIAEFQKKEEKRLGRYKGVVSHPMWKKMRRLFQASTFLASGILSMGAQPEGVQASLEIDMVEHVQSLEEEKKVLSKAEVEAMAKKDVMSALEQLDNWKEGDFAEEVLGEFMKKDVWIVAGFLEKIQGEPYEQKMVEQFIKGDPSFSLSRWQNRTETQTREVSVSEKPFVLLGDMIDLAFEESEDPYIQYLGEIAQSSLDSADKRTLAEIAYYTQAQGLSVEEAFEITMDEHKLWDAQIEILRSLEDSSKEILEKRIGGHAKNRIEIMNITEFSDRFQEVEGASTNEIYSLLAFGGENGRPSVVRPLVRKLLKEMQSQNISAKELADHMEDMEFTTFMKVLAENNRLEKFLDVSESLEEKQFILKKLFVKERLEQKKDLEKVAQIISSTRWRSEGKLLQQMVQEGYEDGTKSEKEHLAYELLSQIYQSEATWLEGKDIHKVPVFETLESEALFNQEGVNTQTYYFYNDGDGYYAFLAFVERYKSDGWQVEDFDTFVKVSKQVKDRRIDMYANKPLANTTGEWSEKIHSEKDVDTLLQELGSARGISVPSKEAWSDGIVDGVEDMHAYIASQKQEITVQTHRGHVYYNYTTMEQLTPNTLLFFDGSCGGAGDIARALEQAPDAQILANTDEGRGEINDEIMRLVNNQLLQGEDVSWSKVRKQAELQVKRGHEEGDQKDQIESMNVFNRYTFPDEKESQAYRVGILFEELTREL